MVKKFRRFFKNYLQLGVVLIVIIAGLALDITRYHIVAHWLLSISALILVLPLLWGMLRSVRDGEYGIDLLAATTIIASVILKEYWAGMVILLMLTGGEALEDYAEGRAKVELKALLERAPSKAVVVRSRKTLEVPISEVRVGDKLIIKPGDVVPVDSILLEGASSFDESSLTGESLTVDKTVGDQLLGGAVNAEGAITAKAIRLAADSQLEQIIKLVRSAGSSQSKFVRLADRYSVPFSIVAFVIAGTAWALSGEALRFLEVLVVATPCPLILGAPTALISGMSRAAKHGIIIKTGSSMERLASVQTFAFDKTGTLTHGTPTVESVIAYGQFTEGEILEVAAALEQSSTHILAKAIIQAAQKKSLKIVRAKHVKEEAGQSLLGRVKDREIVVGRLSFLQKQGIKLPKKLNQRGLTHTTSFVAINDQLAGAITFIDDLRADSTQTLRALQKAGVRHMMLVTGDNATAATAVAKKLGISEVKADCLPVDKIHAIEAAQHHPVAFVGDGVNDAPVLTAADVGIALGARGSTAASESADVVIMLDNISRVAMAYDIAKRTLFIGKQTIFIGIGLSLGLMAVFATGRFKPVYGAGLQEVVDVAVIINALRARGHKQDKL